MKKNKALSFLKKYSLLTIGAIIFAVAIELLLVPNQLIDGGIVGISLLTSHLTGINFGILLVILNLPFLIVGYKHIGRSFVIATLYAIVIGSISTNMLHHFEPFITDDKFLAAIFGGILLGVGVGLVIRIGGSLDGTEIVAIMLDKRIPFSVGEMVMFFNVFILGSAGFVFGLKSALYSMVAYYIAFKVIDITISGLEEMRSATIISDNYKEIAEAINHRLGRTSTFFEGYGGFSQEKVMTVKVIFSRLEESKFKTIMSELDPDAFYFIDHVSEVHGRGFKKNNIH